MSQAPEQKGNKPSKQLAAIDRLLIAGIKQGPAKKRDAINRILELVPEWRRGDCWQRIRSLRKTPELAALEERCPDKAKKSQKSGSIRRSFSSPWTPADDDRLLNLAGYEPVRKIAQRLGRSVRAVRFRLGALGMSARVTDGWSLRALRKLLRVSTARLRYLIGTGLLRVRDPRISASSLAVFCDENQASVDPSALERVAAALNQDDGAFSWERVADLLGLPLAQVQSLIQVLLLHVHAANQCDVGPGEVRVPQALDVGVDQALVPWLGKQRGYSHETQRRLGGALALKRQGITEAPVGVRRPGIDE